MVNGTDPHRTVFDPRVSKLHNYNDKYAGTGNDLVPHASHDLGLVRYGDLGPSRDASP